MLEMFAEGIIRVLIVPKGLVLEFTCEGHDCCRYGHTIRSGSKKAHQGWSKTTRCSKLPECRVAPCNNPDTATSISFAQPSLSKHIQNSWTKVCLLESKLHESHILRDWARSFFPRDLDRTQVMDVLSFTFLAQRLVGNPFYYGFRSRNLEENLSRLVDKLVEDVK
jgi:antiviral helicase SLH1